MHENYETSGTHIYLDRDPVAPGESTAVLVQLISPDVYPRCLWVGRVLSVKEGTRKVGELEVTQIFNSSLEVDPAEYEPLWTCPPGLDS